MNVKKGRRPIRVVVVWFFPAAALMVALTCLLVAKRVGLRELRVSSAGDVDDGPVAVVEEEPLSEPSDRDLPAAEIQVDTVEFNQGVGILIVRDRRRDRWPTGDVPFIANRGALFRVFWSLGENFVPRRIRAVLRLSTPESPSDTDVDEYEKTMFIAGPPGWDRLDESFSFSVDGVDIQPETRFSISLFEADGIVPGIEGAMVKGWRYPEEGMISLGVAPDPMELEVVIVPVSMDCTPHRARPVSLRRQEILWTEVFNMFPVSDLRLSFAEPVSLSVSPCGNPVGILAALARLREEALVRPGVYYHGVFEYEERKFFEEGFDAGFSSWYGGRPRPDDERVSYSVAFKGGWVNNVVHELGHSLGRPHTFEDPDYQPKDGAMCGRRVTWGWGVLEGIHGALDTMHREDLRDVNASLFAPTIDLGDGEICDVFRDRRSTLNDLMSYAYPFWVSAYTFGALAKQIRQVTAWDYGALATPWIAENEIYSIHGFFMEESSVDEWVLIRGRFDDTMPLDSDHGATVYLLDGETRMLPLRQKYSGNGLLVGVAIPLPDDLPAEAIDRMEVRVDGDVYQVEGGAF